MTASTDQRLAADAGAPPTADAPAASPPAWHPDPVGRFPLRYWDGTAWTANVVNAERQVGVDRGWAEAMAAASAGSAAAPAPAVPAVGPGVGPQADERAAVTSPDRERTAPDEPPLERFDISPAAVRGPRAASAPTPNRGDVDVDVDVPAQQTAPAGVGAVDDAGAADGAPTGLRRWARSGATSGRGTAAPDASTQAGPLTRIGGVKVLAVAGVALVVLAVGLGLAWASAGRSYDAQEAWERRAEEWEERAGDHANERDEAIARIGRSRGRNRELTEEIAEQQRQIEDLAASNAALTDENRLLNDALNSLGYELAP